jgi:hypothetical protein
VIYCSPLLFPLLFFRASVCCLPPALLCKWSCRRWLSHDSRSFAVPYSRRRKPFTRPVFLCAVHLFVADCTGCAPSLLLLVGHGSGCLLVLLLLLHCVRIATRFLCTSGCLHGGRAGIVRAGEQAGRDGPPGRRQGPALRCTRRRSTGFTPRLWERCSACASLCMVRACGGVVTCDGRAARPGGGVGAPPLQQSAAASSGRRCGAAETIM